MQSLGVGDYVWIGPAGSAEPAVIEEMSTSEAGLKGTMKVRYVAGQAKSYRLLREITNESCLRHFTAGFEENAASFLKREGSATVLEEVARKLGWTQGLQQLKDLLPLTPRKHGRSEPCGCAVCHRVIGGTIPCQGCSKVYVHRKCGKVEGTSWTCEKCSTASTGCLDLRRTLSDSRTPTTSSLFLARSVSEQPAALVSKDRLQPDLVLEKIKALAKTDDQLYRVIAEKQHSFRSQVTEFEEKKHELKQVKFGDQDYRKAHFRLQETHLNTLTLLRKELQDQLQAAHVFGFESFKVLQKQAGLAALEPCASEQEQYRKCQRQVVDKLLTAELRAEVHKTRCPVRPEIRKHSSIGTLMLTPESQSCVYRLLASCKKKLNERQCRNELTLPLLSAIVKVAHDATSANSFGNGTDPREFERLLRQIRHRF